MDPSCLARHRASSASVQHPSQRVGHGVRKIDPVRFQDCSRERRQRYDSTVDDEDVHRDSFLSVPTHEISLVSSLSSTIDCCGYRRRRARQHRRCRRPADEIEAQVNPAAAATAGPARCCVPSSVAGLCIPGGMRAVWQDGGAPAARGCAARGCAARGGTVDRQEQSIRVIESSSVGDRDEQSTVGLGPGGQARHDSTNSLMTLRLVGRDDQGRLGQACAGLRSVDFESVPGGIVVETGSHEPQFGTVRAVEHGDPIRGDGCGNLGCQAAARRILAAARCATPVSKYDEFESRTRL